MNIVPPLIESYFKLDKQGVGLTGANLGKLFLSILSVVEIETDLVVV
jgi:hypothetical protein